MAADQRKAGAAMIELGTFPARRGVAALAIAPVGTLMHVVLGVAGSALRRSALVGSIDVTGSTGGSRVRPQ